MSRYDTYETAQPWVLYHYGATHDRWWPVWTSTRILGYAVIVMECAICGTQEVAKLRMPRFGAITDTGKKHPLCVKFLTAHAHPEKAHTPIVWAKPLVNPAVFPQRP